VDPNTALAKYRQMRNFAQTPEPGGTAERPVDEGAFVVQKHAARILHYDFRLELDGTLKSWAVPKGPSLDPSVKRMAVEVEDHPLSYAGFEGVIPPGHYGAGTVIVWDRGSWAPVGDAHAGLRDGHLKFDLDGEKLHGRWALVRMKARGGEKQPTWLLMKERDDQARAADEYDVLTAAPDSVLGKAKSMSTAKTAAKQNKRSETKMLATPPTTGRSSAPKAPVTHAERVIDAESGVTKGELAAYYARVSDLMLPHLKARPVALVRAPGGVGGPQFFQKHADENELPGIGLLDKTLDPGHDALLVVASPQGLLSAAQMNVVEFHTWNMTARAISKPDRMIFDLDPGTGVAWAAVREGAELLRAFLDELGLACLAKTSGGKGLHVVVPLAPRHDWQSVRQFSRAIVAHMADVVPQRFVLKSGPRNRVGKIFIDYLRNGWGATTASAWSARARPGLGVSVPIDWSELSATESGAHWNVRNIDGRFATGNAPWDMAAVPKQTLAKAMKALDFKPARSAK
jgi:DNA ligase D-like protein (predicted polymerase)/DNA ligase D-like protein (predicted 3'-phosphoesterase)